jgi:hypothetical protein
MLACSTGSLHESLMLLASDMAALVMLIGQLLHAPPSLAMPDGVLADQAWRLS